jgi:drug/metabolite transporter (DMT)-like permease
MTTSPSRRRSHVILAFALVYVFWGSTYLGIRIAVESVPPALMAGARFLTAGLLMVAWCAWRGRAIRLTWRETLQLALIGVLLLTTSNVVLAWAEQTLPTGLSALIVSITPLWFLLIETWILRGDRISHRGIVGLVLGICGIAVLLWPKLSATSALGHAQLLAALALLGASLSWAIGSVLSKRWQSSVDPFVASGWEMVFAGLVNVVLGLALGDGAQAHWNARGIGAIAYLVVFGSWVGFSAYIWLLNNVPMPKVATYAYVNPVVAVFLGWLVLREHIDAYILVGSAIVVASVALTTSAKVKTAAGKLECPELAEVEGTGD